LWFIFPRNGLISHDSPEMSGLPSKQIRITGEFRHGIDPKNRITIPSDWRTGDGDEFFVRLHSSGSHILAFPPEKLDKDVAEIQARTEIPLARRQELIRQLSAGVRRCNADKQGRMVLPDEFRIKADLKPEVELFLLGGYDHFQIWNPQRWTAERAVVEIKNQELAGELGI